ncbi:hypothetical protein E2493_13375 [Sphingomonas parva]|uniref:Peptidase M61 catalytic domain-containing protein n=1 Tax=Sphingomonas parva TaxID=2555898 RepID=A0A4Y8ZP75_9SPHN|nr:hypothetical protein [Sphingomonas parva]TFI57811.1 hypothetical protein E2493_13375 [Sphingomonas parva]
MRLKPGLALAAGLLLAAAKAPEQRTMHYRVTPGFWFDGTESFQVDLRFRGDADGETLLQLPSEWAGSTELWRQIVGLEIRGATSLGGFYDKPVIRHRPGARLRVRYFVVSPWREDPGFAYGKARPIVRSDWFFWHGEGVFAHPEGREARPARFRWGKLPRGWTVASDLDHLRGRRTELANMIDSVAIGGTRLNVVERDIGGAPFRLATIGRWTFAPEQLADTVAPIVEAENAFWGDRSAPLLVAMAPIGNLPSGLFYVGTGRTDAFSIASTSAFELKHAKRFLAHEYMHSWVPLALGALPVEKQPSDYWFSEGFTDYLASKVLLRAGLWSASDYVADKNETLLRYGTSPARSASAEQVVERFWEDEAVRQLSYDRGHLLAAMLDAEIFARSQGADSLDAVLRAQRDVAKGSSALATSLFAEVLKGRTGIDVAPLIDRYARRGEMLRLPDTLFGGCARLVSERRRAFERGYDADATREADGLITGVDPLGPAFAAGMRDGMRLVGREDRNSGDSAVEIAYRVADAGGERVLRYLPQGKEEFEVQRLELDGRETDPACGVSATR